MVIGIPGHYRAALSTYLSQLGPAERRALLVGMAIGEEQPEWIVGMLAECEVSIEFGFRPL